MDKVKNGLIVILIVLIGLFGFFGGRAVKKYREEVAALKMSNTTLNLQNSTLNIQIRMKGDTIKKKDLKIQELMQLFQAKDKKIAILSADLDSALKWLYFITDDNSYQFLTTEAYVYPGTPKFLFNGIQIKHIHSDYLVARSSEKIIPVMTAQLNNCKDQFVIRDDIEKELKNINELQKQTLVNCEKINTDNDKIIKDVEKQRDKEKRRKNFWRFSASVATGVALVLAVFGI